MINLSIQQQESFDFEPYRKLIAAVLQQAIQDLKKPPKEDCYPADRWIRSRSEEPFSCAWCCRVLDIDPEVFRQRVKAMLRRRGLKKYVRCNSKREASE